MPLFSLPLSSHDFIFAFSLALGAFTPSKSSIELSSIRTPQGTLAYICMRRCGEYRRSSSNDKHERARLNYPGHFYSSAKRFRHRKTFAQCCPIGVIAPRNDHFPRTHSLSDVFNHSQAQSKNRKRRQALCLSLSEGGGQRVFSLPLSVGAARVC